MAMLARRSIVAVKKLLTDNLSRCQDPDCMHTFSHEAIPEYHMPYEQWSKLLNSSSMVVNEGALMFP